uniref:Uncharacterized protein n=1 Tax=Rhizophora mucronata TaxID=61149 RepID=A0A2P2QZM7_RHIMU
MITGMTDTGAVAWITGIIGWTGIGGEVIVAQGNAQEIVSHGFQMMS